MEVTINVLIIMTKSIDILDDKVKDFFGKILVVFRAEYYNSRQA
jgi:hypothetical protein